MLKGSICYINRLLYALEDKKRWKQGANCSIKKGLSNT